MIKYFVLFMAGSILGFVFEIFLTLFKKDKEKPGFLYGPYLPVHGVGIAFMFFICTLNISSFWQIVIISISLTAIEYLSGLIFNKLFQLNIWDYSNNFANLQGQICLGVSLVWTAFTVLFVLVIYPWLAIFLKNFNNIATYLVLGLFAIVFLTDIVLSILKSIGEKNQA